MLIGLTGKARSGKDAAYRVISDECAYGLTARRDAFADRMKWSAACALGFKGSREAAIEFCNELKQSNTYVHVMRLKNGYITKPNRYVSGREYLQFYGTEAHRAIFGEDFWIDAVLGTYHPGRGHELLVITDVRMINEANAIHDRGGQVWRVERPNQPDPEDKHLSEQPLPDDCVDATLVNDGTFEGWSQTVATQLASYVNQQKESWIRS